MKRFSWLEFRVLAFSLCIGEPFCSIGLFVDTFTRLEQGPSNPLFIHFLTNQNDLTRLNIINNLNILRFSNFSYSLILLLVFIYMLQLNYSMFETNLLFFVIKWRQGLKGLHKSDPCENVGIILKTLETSRNQIYQK